MANHNNPLQTQTEFSSSNWLYNECMHREIHYELADKSDWLQSIQILPDQRLAEYIQRTIDGICDMDEIDGIYDIDPTSAKTKLDELYRMAGYIQKTIDVINEIDEIDGIYDIDPTSAKTKLDELYRMAEYIQKINREIDLTSVKTTLDKLYRMAEYIQKTNREIDLTSVKTTLDKLYRMAEYIQKAIDVINEGSEIYSYVMAEDFDPTVEKTKRYILYRVKDYLLSKSNSSVPSHEDWVAVYDLLTLISPDVPMPTWNQALHDPLYKSVLKKLVGFNLTPSVDHKNSIKQVIQILMKPPVSDRNKPIVLPLPPGYGKSTILKELIINRLEASTDWCALIVLERVDDIYKQVDEISSRTKRSNEIEVWPTFTTQLTCPVGLHYFQAKKCKRCRKKCPVKQDLTHNSNEYIPEPDSFASVKTCPAGKHANEYQDDLCPNCAIRKNSQCSVFSDRGNSLYIDKRVLYVTHEYYYLINAFANHHSALENYRNISRFVYVDERPKLVKTYHEDYQSLFDTQPVIKNNLPNLLDEYKVVLAAYSKLFANKGKEYFDGLDKRLSPNFLKQWKQFALRNDNIDSERMRSLHIIARYGGYYEPNSYDGKENATTAANYMETQFTVNPTVILDGTGQFDNYYDINKFNVMKHSELRYSNLHFHFCNIELSKNHYKNKLDSNKTYIDEFCADIIKLARGQDSLVLCYKKFRNDFRRCLKKDNISIDHFGNLLGKNDYSTATTVVFTGILTYQESDYAAVDFSINGKCESSQIPQRIKAMELNQKLVQIYQYVFRTKLRHHDPRDEIHVYLPTSHLELREKILAHFPKSKQEVWLPKPIFPHGDLLWKIVTNQKSDSKSGAVKEYLRQTKSIPTTKEIMSVWPKITKQYATNLRAKAKTYMEK